MSNTSWHIVGLVREKIGSPYVTASDTDVANALNISRAAISTYKKGGSVMSTETFSYAQMLLHLPPIEADYYLLTLSKERARDKCEIKLWDSLLERTKETIRGSKVAGILVAGFMALGAPHDAQALENKGFATPYPAEATSPILYIMVN